MAPLIKRVRAFLADRQGLTKTCMAPFDLPALAHRFGFAEKRSGRAEVILAEETAVELGHPSTASLSIVLISYQPDLVEHGRISIVGADLDRMDGVRPFAQVVMLAVGKDRVPDPFEVDNTQYLMHRLPGYMVRSVPGRLWARIGKKGRAAGLTLKIIGSALIAAYTGDFRGVEKAEVVFVTAGRDNVEGLAQIATEADILAGRHKKLVLGVDGEVECSDLDCESCEEQTVCDNLRDIIIKRRGGKPNVAGPQPNPNSLTQTLSRRERN